MENKRALVFKKELGWAEFEWLLLQGEIIVDEETESAFHAAGRATWFGVTSGRWYSKDNYKYEIIKNNNQAK